MSAPGGQCAVAGLSAHTFTRATRVLVVDQCPLTAFIVSAELSVSEELSVFLDLRVAGILLSRW